MNQFVKLLLITRANIAIPGNAIAQTQGLVALKTGSAATLTSLECSPHSRPGR